MIDTSWIILLIIFTTCSASNTPICLPEWKCKCKLGGKLLDCPTGNNSSFDVMFTSDNAVNIKCKNYPQWPEFHLFNISRRVNVEYMTMSGCDLPMNSSINEISSIFSVENIRHLELYNSNAAIVKNLSTDLFADIPHLFWLELSGSNVHLPVGIFNKTPELTVLYLRDDMIRHLEPGIFDPLTNLESLDLERNNLAELKSGIFDNLVSLMSLDLSWNNLTILPDNIFAKLKSLTSLELSNNCFSSLPEGTLKHNPNILDIALWNNTRNMTLPKKLFANLKHLEEIDLDHNGWSTVSEDLFWGSISLWHIDLAHNYFETLPKRIFEGLYSSEELYLNSNRLITLPDGIFSDTINLIMLNLSENCFTTISRNLFSNLTSLKILDMQRNQLQEIEDTSFNSLKNLEIAYFSHNQFTFSSSIKNKYKSKSPFHSCTSLGELYLNNNSILQIFEDWVKNFTQLRILDLSYNKIPFISVEDLQFVSYCITVKLGHNEIQHIYMNRSEEIATSQKVVHYIEISVDNNPIICDRNLSDFVCYLKGKMHPYVQINFIIDPGYDSICHVPRQMYKVSVFNLTSMYSKYLNSESRSKQCPCWKNGKNREFVVDCSYKNLRSVEFSWNSHSPYNGGLIPPNFEMYIGSNRYIPTYELTPCYELSSFQIIKSLPENICDLSMNWSLGDYMSEEESDRKDVEKLLFQPFGNLRTILTRNHLKGFPNLQQLILSSNGITHLSSDIFADVPYLVLLDLRNNSVHLPPGVFNNTPTLKVLELSHNMMHGIEPGILDPLTKLQTLNFSLNNFTEFKSGTFDKLASLTSLDLSSNSLNTLPENIFVKATNMEVLELNNNSFNSLPAHLLRKNTKLKYISLCNNRNNMTLPDTFFENLTELKYLVLKYNGWIMLPKNIFRSLTSLESITLERNDLLSLDEHVFWDLVSLMELDLSYNKLTMLPNEIFFQTTKLTHLNLAGNRFTSLNRDVFTNLKSLRTLNMEQNQLQAFKVVNAIFDDVSVKMFINHEVRGVLLNWHILEELNLAKNNISEFYHSWSPSDSHLRLLNLSYNNIPHISTRNQRYIPRNITLDLRHNKIQHIELNGREEYEVINGHMEILITDNPIVCDCNLYNFLYYLDRRVRPASQQFVHIMAENLTCHGPEWTNGTVVSQLQWKTFKCPKLKPCPIECSCWIKPNDKVFLVDCSYRNLTTEPMNIKSIPSYRLEINFTGNQFIKIPPLININSNDTSISKLCLANNNINDISVEELSSNVEALELHNNSIKKLKSEVIQFLTSSTTLKTLTLHGNPWICDCNSKDFLYFIYFQTPERILNSSLIQCKDFKIPVREMKIEDLCPNSVMMFVGASFAIVIIALIISTVIALYYRYQREVKVWLYAHESCLWLVTEDELDKDKPYDAFISYSHKDEDFVINELIPKLENGPRPFKLCVHFRNWLAGEYIPTQIIRSIEDSRRTIVVLSTNFINSVWGRMEFKAAHCQALSEGRTRLILIMYGEINVADHLDPDLKAYLNMHTYIMWGDPWFWNKLRYALPHRPELANNCGYEETVL